MRPRRWLSEDARLLVESTGKADPIDAIRFLAASLIDEAALTGPPFSPRILASFRGISDIRRKPMASAARLVPENNALIIEVNEAHSNGKQNFSIDHDVTHTLLPTYTRIPIDDVLTGRFSTRFEEELLCDIGASALLLDPRWLRPLALAAGPSLRTLFEMADNFGASLQATALKLAELNIWPCAFVFWEEGFRKEERVPDGQIHMLGLESFGAAHPKLRVNCSYCAVSFPFFVAPNKSVSDGSLIVKCLETEGVTAGVESLDLGRGTVDLFCQNVFAPYRVDSIIHRRVISLLMPDGTKSAASPDRIGVQESL